MTEKLPEKKLESIKGTSELPEFTFRTGPGWGNSTSGSPETKIRGKTKTILFN